MATIKKEKSPGYQTYQIFIRSIFQSFISSYDRGHPRDGVVFTGYEDRRVLDFFRGELDYLISTEKSRRKREGGNLECLVLGFPFSEIPRTMKEYKSEEKGLLGYDFVNLGTYIDQGMIEDPALGIAAVDQFEALGLFPD